MYLYIFVDGTRFYSSFLPISRQSVLSLQWIFNNATMAMFEKASHAPNHSIRSVSLLWFRLHIFHCHIIFAMFTIFTRIHWLSACNIGMCVRCAYLCSQHRHHHHCHRLIDKIWRVWHTSSIRCKVLSSNLYADQHTFSYSFTWRGIQWIYSHTGEGKNS